MFVTIADFLTPEELKRLRELVGMGRWEDGEKTAGKFAKEVKENEQMTQGPWVEEMRRVVHKACERNSVFQAAALPLRFTQPRFNRYAKGMSYGEHMDNAVFRIPNNTVRTDVSCTIFLSDPESYEGGVLSVSEVSGTRDVKLPAGHAIVYPSTTLHQVTEVTKGERVGIIFWVQSLVRDAAKREILFDLDRARRAMFEEQGRSDAFDLIAKSYVNLTRLWAET